MNQFVKLVKKNSYFKCHDTILIKFEEFICIKKKLEVMISIYRKMFQLIKTNDLIWFNLYAISTFKKIIFTYFIKTILFTRK